MAGSTFVARFQTWTIIFATSEPKKICGKLLDLGCARISILSLKLRETTLLRRCRGCESLHKKQQLGHYWQHAGVDTKNKLFDVVSVIQIQSVLMLLFLL